MSARLFPDLRPRTPCSTYGPADGGVGRLNYTKNCEEISAPKHGSFSDVTGREHGFARCCWTLEEVDLVESRATASEKDGTVPCGSRYASRMSHAFGPECAVRHH